MAEPAPHQFDVGRPTRFRDQVPLWLLMVGLTGSAIVWAIQFTVIASFAGLSCVSAGSLRHVAPHYQPGYWIMLGTNIGALVLSTLCLLAAFDCLRRTGRTTFSRPAGVLRADEGRSRFLAIWGVASGILFTVGIAFNTIAIFWGGLCV
jgi:hypothetical protein